MPGQLGRRAVPAVSVLLALVLLAALAVAAFGPGTAGAPTVLLRGSAVATLPDGSSAALAEGEEVPRGAVVEAGRDGAVLRTLDRDTWLSGDALVQVVDGARQELRRGFVMVDARRGPGLELATPSAAVSTPDGAVSRVESGALLRVGAYTGDAVRVRAAGRRATVEVARDYQVQVPDGGLPGRVTPLVLTPGDPYERALAADLVMADEALVDVARRLDAEGRAAVLVRAAADTDLAAAMVTASAATTSAAGAPPSEQTLAYLLARAADDGDGLADRFARVRSLRSEGGSWGVVADLVGAEVEQVAALLDSLLAPGAESALAVEDDVDVAALLGLGGSSAAAPSSPAEAPPVAADSPAAPPADGGDDPPPPPPPPPAGPVPPPPTGPVPPPDTGLVDAVVETVLGLLPDDPEDDGSAPTDPDVPSLPGDPSPSPSPSPSSGGLLSGLLSP